MKSKSILLVDDSSVDLEIVSIVCANLGCELEAVGDPIEALEKYKLSRHSLVLTDYMMEPINGMELVHQIKEINPDANCLIMTGCPDARLINYVNEVGMGDVITKPIRPAHLLEQIRVALNLHRGATSNLGEIAFSNRMDQCVALLGHSDEISLARKKVVEFSKVHKTIFIEGPFGVGKPDVIKLIHRLGPYSNSQIVFCQCDEMSREEMEEKILSTDGKWGSSLMDAEQGTLVLGPLQFIPMELQSVLGKHLKAISGKCRVIALANALIDDLLKIGEIDEELYFELSLNTIHLPALSKRPADIAEIVRFVVASPDTFGLERKLQQPEIDRLVEELRKCELEGNLRELIQRVKAAATAGIQGQNAR